MSDTPKMPDHPLCEAVGEAIEELDRLECMVRRARTELTERVRDLSGMADRSERLRAVRWLYWNEERVKAVDVTAALFDGVDSPRLQSQMRRLVGPLGEEKCSFDGCSNMVPVRARSQTHFDCGGHRPEPLTPEEWEAREAAWQRQREKDDADFARLSAKSGLTEDELLRLYHLAAEFMWERGRRS